MFPGAHGPGRGRSARAAWGGAFGRARGLAGGVCGWGGGGGFLNIAPDGAGVLRLTKRVDRMCQDVGEKCIGSGAGGLSLGGGGKVRAWVENYAMLLNVGFGWGGGRPASWGRSCRGSTPPVARDLICKALRGMKCGKAAGPSGIIVEMLVSLAWGCLRGWSSAMV